MNYKNNKQNIIQNPCNRFRGGLKEKKKQKYSKIYSQYLVFYNLDNLLLVTEDI